MADDFDFGPITRISDYENMSTLQQGGNPWEHMLRLIESDLNELGWDGYPSLLLVQHTKGDEMAMIACAEVPLPPEPFRANPITFLSALFKLVVSDQETRAKFGQTMTDSPIVGIVFCSEGYGIRGTDEEVSQRRAEAKAAGLAFKDLPDRIEMRNVLGIPRAEMCFYQLGRTRGVEGAEDEVDFTRIGDPEFLRLAVSTSRSHALALGLLMEFIKIQEERYGAAPSVAE